jgi:hypothetical protein
MKKLMIAALAISAMVACSKDDSADAVLESTKKSMVINITNTAPATRGITDTAVGASSLASTSAEDLVFGFCDGSGNLVTPLTVADAKPSADGSYVFHGLDQRISQVYIIANGTPKFTKTNAPRNINEAHTAWETPVVDAEWKDIVVFGHASATHAKNADGTDAFCKVDGHEYPLYEAIVTVKPHKSRLEVRSISCTDLGEKYNKITLKSLELKDVAMDLGDVKFDAKATPKVNSYSLDGKKVWSWNLKQQVIPDLTLHVTVDEGNNWEIPKGTEQRTVTVINYKAPTPGYTNLNNVWTEGPNKDCLKEFVAGEIYVLDLNFKEENIHTDADMLCVDVNVTIADWVVVPVTPEFQ